MIAILIFALALRIAAGIGATAALLFVASLFLPVPAWAWFLTAPAGLAGSIFYIRWRGLV